MKGHPTRARILLIKFSSRQGKTPEPHPGLGDRNQGPSLQFVLALLDHLEQQFGEFFRVEAFHTDANDGRPVCARERQEPMKVRIQRCYNQIPLPRVLEKGYILRRRQANLSRMHCLNSSRVQVDGRGTG